MLHIKTSCVAIATGLILLSGIGNTAYAQDGDSGFSLGIGVQSEENAYGDSSTSGAPLIHYENRYFRFSGTTADLKMPWISSSTVDVSLRAKYSIGEGYEASDADILSGMAEREDNGVWAGAAVQWRPGFADFTLEGLADTSGDSDGQRLRLEASRTFSWDRFSITPRIAATWMNDDAVDYFYGVRPNEVTAGRPAYIGEATTNIELGLKATYSITEKHTILFDAGITYLGDSITDSPITTEDTATSIGVGYVYRF